MDENIVTGCYVYSVSYPIGRIYVVVGRSNHRYNNMDQTNDLLYIKRQNTEYIIVGMDASSNKRISRHEGIGSCKKLQRLKLINIHIN